MITRISHKHLKNPKESRSNTKSSRDCYLTSNNTREYCPVGDILAASTEKLLTKAVPLPGDKKRHNFEKHPTKVADSGYMTRYTKLRPSNTWISL